VRNATVPGLNGTCDDIYIYSNVNRIWRVYLSMVPIYLVIWGVLMMNKSSQIVAPSTLIVTVVLCMLYFSDLGFSKNADTVQTAGIVLLTIVDRVLWTVFEYAYNVFAAFIFLRVVQLWGIVGLMKNEFENLAYDVERKIILIMFNFAVMCECYEIFNKPKYHTDY
jgi:L-lactate permease